MPVDSQLRPAPYEVPLTDADLASLNRFTASMRVDLESSSPSVQTIIATTFDNEVAAAAHNAGITRTQKELQPHVDNLSLIAGELNAGVPVHFARRLDGVVNTESEYRAWSLRDGKAHTALHLSSHGTDIVLKGLFQTGERRAVTSKALAAKSFVTLTPPPEAQRRLHPLPWLHP